MFHSFVLIAVAAAPCLSPSGKRERVLRGQEYYYNDDKYAKYDDDRYYYDDDVTAGGGKGAGYPVAGKAGKGKMTGSKKPKGPPLGKGKGKGKGSAPADDNFYPSVDDITYVDDLFFDDAFFEEDVCTLVNFNETFAISGPSLFLAPDTTLTEIGTPSLPGTVFIFERSSVYELDGVTPIVGATISGACTRTTIGEDGGGTCQLVFLSDDGYSITVEGYLPGPFGGPMAITGGTGSMVAVVGEMDFFPIFSDPATVGDIFLDVIRYEVIADIGVIVCE